MRTVLRRAALAGSVGAAGVLAAALVAGPAHADAPTQVGWWGTGPSPTTPAGGMHLEVAPQQLLAYGAALFALPSTATGTLTLKITGTNGTGTIEACPTKDTTWKAGDDQPMSAAPAYDCSAHALQGVVAADGSSVSFLVDGSFETLPGTLSLAIVPLRTTGLPVVGTDAGTDVTEPFAVDFAKPDASTLTVTGGSPAPSIGPPPASPPPPAGAQTGATGSTGTAPPAGAVSVPAADGAALLPTGTSGAAPLVAGPSGTAPNGAATGATVAAQAPSTDNRAHDAATWLLVLLAVAVLTGNAAPGRRAPRRLVGAAAAAPPPPVVLGPRGLGRFARDRNGPPRPLT